MPAPDGWVAVTIGAGRSQAPTAVADAGLPLLQIDGQWWTPAADAQAVQAIVNGFDDLGDAVAGSQARVDAELARRDTLVLGGAEDRLALLAEGVALLAKIVYLQQTLSDAERARADRSLGLFARHLALLAAAAAIKADIAAQPTPEAARAYDVAGAPAWVAAGP